MGLFSLKNLKPKSAFRHLRMLNPQHNHVFEIKHLGKVIPRVYEVSISIPVKYCVCGSCLSVHSVLSYICSVGLMSRLQMGDVKTLCSGL